MVRWNAPLDNADACLWCPRRWGLYILFKVQLKVVQKIRPMMSGRMLDLGLDPIGSTSHVWKHCGCGWPPMRLC